jgi:hypothetical protein
MFGAKKKQQQVENLMATGVKAVGTITNVRDTGMTVNDNPRVKMTFQIAPLDGGAPFEGQKTKTVSRVQIPQVGQRYPVWFDAQDPSTFAYAVVDDAEGRAQIAAMFPNAFGPDASGVGLAGAPAPALAATPATSIADRIRQLDALKAAGVVDDAEYADQKARILSAL